MNNKVYSDDFKVLNWWISEWWHAIQVHTEGWKTYKTSLFSQSSFEILASQEKWDRISEIRVRTAYINTFKKATEISDQLKSRIVDILKISQ